MRVAIVWLAALAGAFPGYVEITDEKEFGRLYRNECDRCWVNATVSNARCCLERSGHEFLDVAHHCPRDVVPWGLRKSLRSYMRTGNVFASQTGRLYDALRGRSLVIVGDSIARQLAGFLERRHVEHLVDCGGEVCPRLRATVVQRDVAATLEARAAGEGGPVVVVFAGNALHERNATAYAAHVRETLRRLDAIAARYPNVAIFADATAQHFPTATGDFLGARTKVADAIPYYPCVPLTPGAPPNWRAILRDYGAALRRARDGGRRRPREPDLAGLHALLLRAGPRGGDRARARRPRHRRRPRPVLGPLPARAARRERDGPLAVLDEHEQEPRHEAARPLLLMTVA